MSGPGRPRIPLAIAVAGAGVAAALWFLREALAPFFLALVFTYLLEPVVSRLSRWMRRSWASLLVILAAICLLGLVLWAVLPVLYGQAERLIASLPTLRIRVEARFLPWLHAHPAIEAKYLQALQGIDPMALLKGAGSAGAGLLGLLLDAITLILVPLIVYYLLQEGSRLTQALDDLVPRRHLGLARRLAEDINGRLGGYIRGQLGVSAAMSLLQALGFAALGVPYAWLLGLVAGFSNVVPYSPYITALPPALVFAAADGAGPSRLLAVAVVFTVVQKVEALHLTPVWVGRASGLHPLEVLLGILCFGHMFGLPGLIFAVPLTIVLKVTGRAALEAYTGHPWFTAEP